jgi:hypothetical protein
MRKIDIKEDEPIESMEVGREVLDRRARFMRI